MRRTPMKILMINTFLLEGSGSGVYTCNIAKSLTAKGHEVCIIMPEITENYKKYDGIKLHPVFFTGDSGEMIGGQLPFNFPCFTTHPKSTFSFSEMTCEEVTLYKSAFNTAISEEITDFKPDVIHAQHVWILSALSLNRGIPVVITSHGTDIIGYEQSDRFHEYSEASVKGCAHIISISEDNRDSVLRSFPDAAPKITVMKNGYDDGVFYRHPYDKAKVLELISVKGSFDKVVSFAGKMTQIKGIDTLLRAAAIYESGRDDVLTVLAGGGKLFDELKDMAKQLGLKNVVFTGNLDHEILRQVYNIADVSLVTSRFEAFGLVAVEAMACGTPVISTNVGGLPDIIGAETGVIIDVDDVSALAENVTAILNGDLKFDSKTVAEYAYNTYAQSSLINQLIEIYEAIITKGAKQ